MQHFEDRPPDGKQGVINRLKRFVRYWGLKLLRIQATPHNIAIGLAVGVFAGLLPILPFQTLLAVLLAFAVRGSKIAAALGTWVTNPANWVPFYWLCYKIGKAVAPFSVPPFRPSEIEMTEMLDTGFRFFAAMMAGGLILAVPCSALVYFIGKRLVAAYQLRRASRRGLKAGEQQKPGGDL